MQLTAIGLAAALALTSTTAFAMGGGGAGASGGVGSSYTTNPAEWVAWFVLRNRLLP
jgi:hypothetical protein